MLNSLPTRTTPTNMSFFLWRLMKFQTIIELVTVASAKRDESWLIVDTLKFSCHLDRK